VLRSLALLAFLATIGNSQTTFKDLSQAASAAREANDVPKAIELYQSALKLEPDWPEGLFYLGSLFYDSDHYADAESALARFVKITPDAGPALGLLGLCEFESGHYVQSLAHIQQAPAQVGQMGAVLRFHEAQLLAKMGKFDQSLQLFATFLKDGEAPPAVIAPLGIAALRQRLVVSEIANTQENLYTAAGKTAAAILSGNAVQSEIALAGLIAAFPSAPGVHYLCGFYFLGQDPWRAREEFRRELTLNESNSSANAMLAWVLLNHREVEAALPYARKGVDLAPDDSETHYVYGRALAESAGVREGIAHLEKAVQGDPQNLEIHLALASAYSKAGRMAEAHRERERSMVLAREVAPVYLR
jgi:tetratricopeptide (TPR) repeat protein